MEANTSSNSFFIAAYFNDLQGRVAFLEELHAKGRKSEAMLLCCCYIEALGSRQSPTPEHKAKNYCHILVQHGGNKLWPLVHPSQIKSVLSTNGLFGNVIAALVPVIDSLGRQLLDPNDLCALLDGFLNEQQRSWLLENIFKGSMAYISYKDIRSELVHGISAAPISFSQTQYKGHPVPKINFSLLYASLNNIVNTLACNANISGKWWWE